MIQKELLHIEDKITNLFEKCLSQVFAQEDLDLLRTLEQKKDQILDYEESTWTLRSRVIWLDKGDKNTKKNHNYATHRRSQNIIWENVDESGCHKTTDNDIKEIAYNHFKD